MAEEQRDVARELGTEHQVGRVEGEAERGRLADTLRCAGDDRNLVSQTHGRVLS